MKKESRERIIAAYEATSAALSFGNLGGGLRYMCTELEKTLRILRQVRNRSSLEAALTKEPEPSPEQLEARVKVIELLPHTIRKVLPEAAKNAQKHLPYDSGGRPQVLKPGEHSEVCKEIGQLVAQGVPLQIAQQRIAERRGVSLRTIQRVWQKRKVTAAASQPEADAATKP